MDNLGKIKIPLKELSKDISSKLSNGTKKVLILSPNEQEAERLLNELEEDEKNKCEIKVYTYEKYLSYLPHPRKYHPKYKKTERYNLQINVPKPPKIYEIHLHQIELI